MFQKEKRILTKSQAVSILVAIDNRVSAQGLEDIMFYNQDKNHKYFKNSTQELKEKIFRLTNLDEDDIYDIVEDPVSAPKHKM